jgi:hypothetical protein
MWALILFLLMLGFFVVLVICYSVLYVIGDLKLQEQKLRRRR